MNKTIFNTKVRYIAVLLCFLAGLSVFAAQEGGGLPFKVQPISAAAEKPEDTGSFSEVSSDLSVMLHSAFARAFRSRIEFEKCGVFQLLGYTEKDLEQIGYITPNPASFSLSLKKRGENGCFEFISADCRKIRYYGMTVERAVFTFPDCEIDLESLKSGCLLFKGAKRIELLIEVSESDLLAAFASVRQARNLSALKINLRQNNAVISGRVKNGIFVVDFKINGNTRQTGPKTVDFICGKMIMNGSVVPRNTVNGFFKYINPVFNTQNIWLNLNVIDIKIKRGFVETSAIIEYRQ